MLTTLTVFTLVAIMELIQLISLHYMQALNLEGKTIGRWKVGVSRIINGHTYFHCTCRCGKESVVRGSALEAKTTLSCGCLRAELTSKRFFRHGLHSSRFYHIWQSMIARCTNLKHPHYRYYGGKGIKICQQWQKFIPFHDDMYESYLEHTKRYGEKQTTLDRINSDKGYYPRNCRWATYAEQARHNDTLVTWNGHTLSITQWAKRLNVDRYIFYSRISRGKTPEQAIITPIKKRRKCTPP